jgi:thiol-disulfide isomerase/thioredoxin
MFHFRARSCTTHPKSDVQPGRATSSWDPDIMRRRTAMGLLATLPFSVVTHRAPAASQADVLAEADFTDEHGAAHRLTELTRPLVLVNLWAAWCPACLTELPTIQALAAQLGPEAIDVVLLSHAMNWRGDLAYVRDARLPFRHWRLSARMAEPAVAAAFGIEGDRFGLPRTLVFAGRRRALVASHLGSLDWVDPEQLRLARNWLRTAD